MNDKLLPVGAYLIGVQAVGAEYCDGGLLSLTIAEPLPPEVLQSAAAMAIELFRPKTLETIPSGAWWYVTVAYWSMGRACYQLARQEQLSQTLQKEHFSNDLADLVPRLVGQIALSLAARIGVAPLPAYFDPADRPALLN